MSSLGKLKILLPLQKLPKNMGNLSKLIVAKDIKKLPKVQNPNRLICPHWSLACQIASPFNKKPVTPLYPKSSMVAQMTFKAKDHSAHYSFEVLA